MAGFLKFHTILSSIQSKRVQIMNLTIASYRYCPYGTNPGFESLDPSLTSHHRTPLNRVAVFWDLDNKPPKSFPPYDATIRLKKAAESFGVVRYMVAYANRHAFTHIPREVREQRKERKQLNKLENIGVLKPAEPYICRVCGRRFYNNEKLINHFKQIHEREHTKMLNRIESARGSRRVKLVGKYSMKMDKYKYAARDVLIPKVGYGLADELKRAGFCVNMVSDKPQAADFALRIHMADIMDKRRVECVILVSDDKDFVEVLNEAKLRCLRTVVVGDTNDGALKRIADASYSWQEIMMGKAKKEAVSVVGRWKDRDVLKRLEWTYNPERERKLYDFRNDTDFESESSDVEGFLSEEDDGVQKNDSAWWKLEPESVVESR
ncbi:hypothetical protein LguiA_033391 [Lonicera macranthoides]